MRTRFFAAVALLALACAAAAIAPAAAQEPDRALEQRVKAAFLYRFTEFVTWPEAAQPRADAPFVMAVAGSDSVADNLRVATTGRNVGGRPIEVRRIGPSEAIPPAQVVFIGGSEAARVRELVRAAPRAALVVTEAEGALEQGSVINFVLVQDRVRFDISLDSAEKRGLRLSSRLLAVARTVRGIP